MRVCMYYSNRDVRLVDQPTPEIGPGELLVKVLASGICGSDVMEWYRRDKVPLVLGHEVAGVVVQAGHGVTRFKTGDRVAVTHHVPCNTCHYCLAGHHTMCETLLKGTKFHPGGFAEYIRVPAINVDRGTFPVPDHVTDEEASFMEPLACVLRGQRQLAARPGQTVLVLGAGISGLLHVPLARSLGAGLVVAGDTIPYRLEKALEVGAHHALYADDDLPDKLRAVNRGMLADRVIICFDGFIPLALKCVERGGSVLFFAGAAEGACIPACINDIFWRTEVSLTSSYGGAPGDCDQALKLIAGGSLPLQKLISHRLPLAEAQKGFGLVCDPVSNRCVKVILLPHADAGADAGA
ncbi:MAG: alcohol dehydrogenase catalytic domain-containing protein [Thermodesulfobacteriota bacterium]